MTTISDFRSAWEKAGKPTMSQFVSAGTTGTHRDLTASEAESILDELTEDRVNEIYGLGMRSGGKATLEYDLDPDSADTLIMLDAKHLSFEQPSEMPLIPYGSI